MLTSLSLSPNLLIDLRNLCTLLSQHAYPFFNIPSSSMVVDRDLSRPYLQRQEVICSSSGGHRKIHTIQQRVTYPLTFPLICFDFLVGLCSVSLLIDFYTTFTALTHTFMHPVTHTLHRTLYRTLLYTLHHIVYFSYSDDNDTIEKYRTSLPHTFMHPVTHTLYHTLLLILCRILHHLVCVFHLQ